MEFQREAPLKVRIQPEQCPARIAKELIREVARKLAESTPEAEKMRASMRQTVSEKANTKGGIVEILRSWPLAELNLTRPFEEGRKIDL